jgi:uncharacterized protein YkwD
MIRSLLAVAALLALAALLPPCGRAGAPDKGKEPPPKAAPAAPDKALAKRMADDEKALIELVNKARAKAKLPALERDPTLDRAAKGHTENMARQEKMEHVLDGKRVSHRVSDVGYDYLKVGENLAFSEGDASLPPLPPADIHAGWMKSKHHRDNILEKKYTQVGVSMGRSKKGNFYYTMVFGLPDR